MLHKLNKQERTAFANVGTLGLELGLSIVVGVWGGQWLDTTFGTAPIFKWIGLFAGFFAAFRSVYRVAVKTHRELNEVDADHSTDLEATS